MIANLSLLLSSMPLLVLAVSVLLSFLLLTYQKAQHVAWVVYAGMVLSLLSLFGSVWVSSFQLETGLTLVSAFTEVVEVSQHLVVDGFTRLHSGLVLMAGLVVLLLPQKQLGDNDMRDEQSHHFAMFQVSMSLMVLGAILAVAANGLLVLFLGIEILSMGTLGLLFFSRSACSSESHDFTQSMFFRQAISSCVFLFGFALLFAHSGSITYTDMNRALLYDTKHPLLLLGSIMVLFSFCYKLGLVPMQSWFQRLQYATQHIVWLPIMLVASFTLFASIVRFLVATALPAVSEVTVVLMLVSVMALCVMSLCLVFSKDVKFFVSHLMMAQIALCLVVMLALGQGSVMVVNLMLVTMMLGMLLISIALHALWSSYSAKQNVLINASDMAESLQGSYYQQPRLTLVLCVGLLTLAGLPLTVGFMGKFFTLMATVQGLDWFLTCVVILATLLIWYAVAKRIHLFFQAQSEAVSVTVDNNKVHVESTSVVHAHIPKRLKLLGILVFTCIVGFGVYPEPIIQLAKLASIS